MAKLFYSLIIVHLYFDFRLLARERPPIVKLIHNNFIIFSPGLPLVLQIYRGVNNGAYYVEYSQEKDCFLRVLLITLCAVPLNSSEIPAAELLRQATLLPVNPGVTAEMVQLRPWRLWRRNCHATAKTMAKSSTHNYGTALKTYHVQWPVVALADNAKSHRFWPRAGFAFPFACPSLMAIMQLQPYDILVTDDVECGGHVAWRLHEITGVPYVIINCTGQQGTQYNPGTALHKILQTIQCEAEFIVDYNTAVAEARSALIPGIRSRVISAGNTDASTLPSLMDLPPHPVCAAAAGKINEALQFVEILEAAIRQSGEIFSW